MQMRLRWALKSLINGCRGFFNVLLSVSEKMLLIRNWRPLLKRSPFYAGLVGHIVFFCPASFCSSQLSVFTNIGKRDDASFAFNGSL